MDDLAAKLDELDYAGPKNEHSGRVGSSFVTKWKNVLYLQEHRPTITKEKDDGRNIYMRDHRGGGHGEITLNHHL